MTVTVTRRGVWRRHIALPGEHGAWVFLLSPLLMGLFAGVADRPSGTAVPGLDILLLVIAVLAAFLLRQPVSIAVKAFSGRRSREEWPVARFWMGVYGAVALAAVAGLVAQGFGYLLLLAVPAGPVFAWHLLLISRRAERRQLGVELVGSGVLALGATGAYWVMLGGAEPRGWWLWLLAWLQSAASIVYAYLRLGQRPLRAWPPVPERLRLGWRALASAGFTTPAVALACGLGWLPAWIWLAYAVQLAESVWGVLRPAAGVRPTAIGVRQLLVSTLFTLVFILALQV
jgi:hypothetical protein